MKKDIFQILRKHFIKLLFLALLIITALGLGSHGNQTTYEDVNCDKVIEGSHQEILKRRFEVNYSYSGDLSVPSCSFVESRGYFDYPISQIELENKLAYIIVVYKNSKQFERLFHAIYRKSNLYCIHVDKKATFLFWRSIKNLTKCFDNVILIRKHKVEWGLITTLLPEVECMEKLVANTHVDWKYVINLTGEEFPLKSNYQLAKITEALNGSNWIEIESFLPTDRHLFKTSKKIPFDLTLYKGPVHAVMSRGFAEFIVHNETAEIFLDYLDETWIPDETFYATLNFNSHILQVPGAYRGPGDPLKSDLWTSGNTEGTRYKQWKPRKCYGFYSRDICIFGAGDINLMTKSSALFANKFHAYYEPAALNCLDSWIGHKAYSDYLELNDEDFTFYSQLDFTRNHI